MRMTIRTKNDAVIITWPSPSAGYSLQQNTGRLGSLNWSNISDGIYDDGREKRFVVHPGTGSRFYRLAKP